MFIKPSGAVALLALSASSYAPTPVHLASWANRVTNRKPNTLGRVPIVMYHSIGQTEKYMVRSYQNFQKDLERLYSSGYRPVTLADYVDGKFNIPPGSTPVVMTFDDSRESQFRLTGAGRATDDCFVGQWRDFAKTHPDFPLKATFFVLPNGPFGNSKQGKKKIAILKGLGCEIAGHTFNHRFLNKLSDEGVKRELALSKDWLAKIGVKARTMALPYGVNPRNKSLLKGFTYNGKRYKYDAVCLAGDFPARSPSDGKVNMLQLPRIEASAAGDGLDAWLDKLASGKMKAYVVP